MKQGDIPVVYFVAAPDVQRIKIGTTTAARLRLRLVGLMCASPVRLEFLGYHPGDKEAENSLHNRFGTHSVGGEWFHMAGEIMSYVKDNATLEWTTEGGIPGWLPRLAFRNWRKPIAGNARRRKADDVSSVEILRLDVGWEAILKAEYERLKGKRDAPMAEIAEWLLVKQARKWEKRIRRSAATTT